MIFGERVPFPIKLISGDSKIEVKDLDQLINIVFDKYVKTLEELKKEKVKIKITDVLWSLGITEDSKVLPIQLIDHRTLEILERYNYASKFHLEPYDCKVWYEACVILNNLSRNSNQFIFLR